MMEDDGVREMEKREQELDCIVGRLYEDHACGKLDESRFYRLLARYEEEQRQVADCLTLFKKNSRNQDHRGPESGPSAFELLEDVTAVRELTKELLQKMIDRIEICQGSWDNGAHRRHKRQTIRIYYRFSR